MPVMNGWECLKRVRANERYSNTPVIMYSTSSLKQDVEKAIKTGADGFLIKPSNFTDLSLVVSSIVTNADFDFRHVYDQMEDRLKSYFFFADQFR